jgi:hypothetical protein
MTQETAPTRVDEWKSGSGRGCGLIDCLKLERSEFPESALAALALVGPFDPNHNRHPQLLSYGPPMPVEDILLRELEERLHRSVVSARTSPSHRSMNPLRDSSFSNSSTGTGCRDLCKRWSNRVALTDGILKCPDREWGQACDCRSTTRQSCSSTGLIAQRYSLPSWSSVR